MNQVVRAMKITPRPPHRKGMKLREGSFWAALAEEANPPAGEDPICGLLLTSKEVVTGSSAANPRSLHETLGHRSVPPGPQDRVPGGEHPAQDRTGGDPCADDPCGDRMAHPPSDTSRAAVPGPALGLGGKKHFTPSPGRSRRIARRPGKTARSCRSRLHTRPP